MNITGDTNKVGVVSGVVISHNHKIGAVTLSRCVPFRVLDNKSWLLFIGKIWRLEEATQL